MAALGNVNDADMGSLFSEHFSGTQTDAVGAAGYDYDLIFKIHLFSSLFFYVQKTILTKKSSDPLL